MKFHRPLAVFFWSPREARGCAPEASALPATNRLPETPSVTKVQKQSDFGISSTLSMQEFQM